MTETAPKPITETPPETQTTPMLTSWSTTRPELNAGRLMKAFVRVNVYLYTRPPSKARQAINKFFLRVNVYLYQKSEGRLLGRFGDLDALLITTRGRKTGKKRTTPVGYMYDAGRFVACAVPGHFDIPGGPKAVHPAWYLNLRSDPNITIDIGKERIEATADVLSGAERERMWKRFTDVYPFIGEFQKRANRPMPIVVMTPKDLNPKTLEEGN